MIECVLEVFVVVSLGVVCCSIYKMLDAVIVYFYIILSLNSGHSFWIFSFSSYLHPAFFQRVWFLNSGIPVIIFPSRKKSWKTDRSFF